MDKLNRLSTSYGMIVITQNLDVILLERKLPYCVSDYLAKMRKRIDLNMWTFNAKWFLQCNPNLKEHEKVDFDKFVKGEAFEDQWDLPRGQMIHKGSLFKKKSLLQIQFLTAYMEFCEESGFQFDYDERHIGCFPTYTLQFVGCDGYTYIQHYFVVQVNNLVPCSKQDPIDRLVYNGRRIFICEALQLFKKQQLQIGKEDGKYLLLLKIMANRNILYHITLRQEQNQQHSENWRLA